MHIEREVQTFLNFGHHAVIAKGLLHTAGKAFKCPCLQSGEWHHAPAGSIVR